MSHKGEGSDREKDPVVLSTLFSDQLLSPTRCADPVLLTNLLQRSHKGSPGRLYNLQMWRKHITHRLVWIESGVIGGGCKPHPYQTIFLRTVLGQRWIEISAKKTLLKIDI